MPNPTPEEISDPGDQPRGGVRQATRWSAAGKGAILSVRWIVRLWLLTLVPVADIGVMAVAISISGFLTFFADFGTGQAVIRRKKLDEGFLSTVFWTNLALGLGLSAGLWFACSLWVQFSFVAWGWGSGPGPSSLTTILPILGLSFAVLSLGLVQRNLLARRLQFGRVALVSMAEALTYAVTAIWLARAGHGVWALVNGTLAGSAAAVLTAVLLAGWRPRFLYRLHVLHEIWSFSVNLLGAQLTNYGFQQADRIVIAAVLGMEATGYYSAAQQLILFPIRNLTQVLVGVLVPALSRLQDDLEQLRDRLLRALAGIALVVAPCLFGLAAVLHPLVRGFLKDPNLPEDKWAASVVPALLLIPASLLRATLAATGSVYVSQGQTQLMFRWSLLLGMGIVVFYLIGIPFGLPGVAAGFSLIHILFAPKLFGVPLGLVGLKARDAWRAIAPAVVLAMMMGGLVLGFEVGFMALEFGDRLRSVLGIAIGVVVYVVLVLIRVPPGTADLLRLLGMGRFVRATR